MDELKELKEKEVDLDTRVEAGFTGVDQAFADMNSFVGHEFGALRQEMKTRFDRVDKRFDRIDQRFDRLETKLDGINTGRPRTRRPRRG